MSPRTAAIFLILFILIIGFIITKAVVDANRPAPPKQKSSIRPMCGHSDIRRARMEDLSGLQCQGYGDTLFCEDGYELRPDGTVWQIKLLFYPCPEKKIQI